MIEQFEILTSHRKNQTRMWMGNDSEANYHYKSKLGANRYKPGEITYTYNNDGFRCDRFSLDSDIPIVFLGCSYTEGIGLPIEHTWSHIVWTEIVKKTGKNIPYWNIALSGSGLDTQASALYWLMRVKNIRPAHIIGLLPPFARREIAFESNKALYWWPGLNDNKYVNHVVLDTSFATQQSIRSLKIIDSLRMLSDAKLTYTCWEHNSSHDQEIIEKHFPWFRALNCPDKSYLKSYARDSEHFGAEWHNECAKRFIEVLMPDF